MEAHLIQEPNKGGAQNVYQRNPIWTGLGYSLYVFVPGIILALISYATYCLTDVVLFWNISGGLCGFVTLLCAMLIGGRTFFDDDCPKLEQLEACGLTFVSFFVVYWFIGIVL
jgi:hypothetical protein